jgi:YVTN family beta-propeller protein
MGWLAFTLATVLSVVAGTIRVREARAEPWLFIPGGYDGNAIEVIDARTNRIRDVIRAGATPFGLVVNPRGTRAYAMHYMDTAVSVIDTETGVVERTLAACGYNWMAVPSDDRFIYVASWDGSFCKVDTTAGVVVHTFPANPTGIAVQLAVNPQGTRLYTTNSYTAAIDVYNTATYAHVAAIQAGHIEGLAVSRDGTRVYATDPTNGLVVTIDATTNTPIRSAAACLGDAYYLALSPDDRTLYITCSTGGILEFDAVANAVVAQIEPTRGFSGLSITPDGSTLYAPALLGNTIFAISTETRAIAEQLTFPYPAAFFDFVGSPAPTALVAGNAGLAFVDTFDANIKGSAPVGQAPQHVVRSLDNNAAYVSNAGNNSISVVDVPTRSTTATIPLADAPEGLALSPDGRRLFATTGTNISAIDTATHAVTTIETPYYRTGAIAVSHDGQKLFSSSVLGIDVFSVQTGAWQTTIPTGQVNAFAPSRNGSLLYAFGGNTMYEISTLTLNIVGSELINVGPAQIDIHTIALSPREERMYLPNAAGDSVVILDMASFATMAIIALDGAPTDAAISEDGAHLFVTVPERNALEDLATARDTVTVTSNAIPGAAAIANFVEKPGNYILQSGFE